MGFSPRLDILLAPQRQLWEELTGVPPEFTLFGGTAVALHLGHRQSVDFDFFGSKSFTPGKMYDAIPFLRGAKVIQQENDTLTCLVDRDGPIKVSFFGVPAIQAIRTPHLTDDNHLKIASLVDLAATKAFAVQQRAEAKDYVDIDAMMSAGIDLPLGLAAAQLLYGPTFNAQITLKALSYFGDGDLRQLPDEMKLRLVHAVAATDLGRLPVIERQVAGDDGNGGVR